MSPLEESKNIPDTGISGVYELFYATNDIDFALDYFEEFGFNPVKEGQLTDQEAYTLYGHSSALTSWRLQNGLIDSHGLIRLLKWDTFKSKGIGFMPPRTIGQRIAVMMTKDIYRIRDIYEADKENGGKWSITEPITDDLFNINTKKDSVLRKPTVVRENAVYGEFFNHIFFQRFGYHIEGYGTINEDSAMQTSEFTHHDFFVDADDLAVMQFMSSALGLIAEESPKLDGEWQKGPKRVFNLQPGESHWYQGFVSPNNICGKLKFFIPTSEITNKTVKQTMGDMGITMHSFYTHELSYVHQLVEEHGLKPSDILKNEFDELCFTFTGNGKCHWQIIEKISTDISHQPRSTLDITLTKH